MALFAAAQPAGPFDIVLAGGRVMDPASGLDAVRDVGIRGGTIAAISATPLSGATRIDVTGLVVAAVLSRVQGKRPGRAIRLGRRRPRDRHHARREA